MIRSKEVPSLVYLSVGEKAVNHEIPVYWFSKGISSSKSKHTDTWVKFSLLSIAGVEAV